MTDGRSAMSLSPYQQRVLRAMDIEAWAPREAAVTEMPLEDTAAPMARAAADSDAGMRVATAPPDWQALEQAVAGCTRCALHQSRTQTVFGVGNRNAQWMVIGEAPGVDEDRVGEPFVGRAGKLLDAMLRAVGLDRGDVFIANILKCRPPGNRDPKRDEIDACADYLHRQIELIRPALILAVGRIAAQSLLDTDAPVGRLRGRVHATGPAGIPLVVTYHPAYLLRSPAQKAKAWQDLRLAMQTARPRP